MVSKSLDVIINSAIRMANQLRHEYLTLESILYVMVSDDELVAGVIRECGADTKSIKKELTHFMSDSGSFSVLSPEQVEELSKKQFVDEDLRSLAKKSGILYRPEISMALHRVIQRAAVHVQQASGDHLDIRGINILVAMFQEEESFALHTLAKQGIERLSVVQLAAHKYDQEEDSQDGLSDDFLDDEDESSGPKKRKRPSLLEHFCHNLNEMAKENKIDPLIGRAKELKRIMQTLCRRRKNNPLLVGEAGVGKTAIAEGLAWVLVNSDVPGVLSGTTVFSLDMATLVAGAKFRGEFEQRLKAIIKNLEQIGEKGKRPILFIDDIHTVIGAGATTGAGMDASGLLRPILSGGSIRVMGSTTYQEYRKFVEKDAAFGRRFQKIDVDEPDLDETYKILQGLRKHFEEHHGVRYSNKTLKATVELADKYINERKNPDKSIDIIDEVGATVQLLMDKRSQDKGSAKKTNITRKDIETVVAKFAKLPRISVIGSERDRLKTLNTGLKRLIYGQDHAIDVVTDAIILSRSGLGHRERPMGSFLFAGPTGVGKTELARQLAIHLGSHLERFDMSEYGEKHSISRLIGAPPGYVGHEEGGLLTDAVVKHPHCVVLLDEMEKAHPEIYNVLLQVMDYGKLTDTQGRSTDFRNVVIIMTTNAGAKEVDSGNIGLTTEKTSSHKRDQAIKNFFTPEFRNRLDEIVHFNRLSERYILQIVDKFIFQLESNLKEKQTFLDITLEAKKWIGEKGFDPKMGAREISRLVDRELKKPLSKEILFGSLVKGGKAVVSYDPKNKKLVLQFEPSKNQQ